MVSVNDPTKLESKEFWTREEVRNCTVCQCRRLGSFESELKLKNFELERTGLLLLEAELKVATLFKDKELLLEKLDVVREDYTRLHLESQLKQSTLDYQIQDLQSKLSVYIKQEENLDKIIQEAAALSKNNRVESLTVEYASTIPTCAKRRLKYCLAMARKARDFEVRYYEAKESLSKEITLRNEIEEELYDVQFALSLAAKPTTDLLQLIRRKDQIISKLEEDLKESEDHSQSLFKDVKKMKRFMVEIEDNLEFLKSSLEEATAETRRRRKTTKRRHRKPWVWFLPRIRSSVLSLTSSVMSVLHLRDPLTRVKVEASESY